MKEPFDDRKVIPFPGPRKTKRDATSGSRGESCPVCKAQSEDRYLPFCSKRCAEIDLGRWFSESYRVETQEPPDEDGPKGREE